MKKILCLLMAAMLLIPCAMAEADGGDEINTLFTEGSFVVQIDVPEDDEGWTAQEAGDGSVLKLYNAEVIEDTFVARYDAAADGTATVVVKHMKGAVCDRLLTWDVVVRDGAAREVTSGSYTQSPEDGTLTPCIAGDWQINGETVMAGLKIDENPDGGWTMQVAMAYPEPRVLRANLAYDCEKDRLVYADGTYYKNEIGNQPEVKAGEQISTGATGSLTLTQAEDGSAAIAWHDDQHPEFDTSFHRPEDWATRVIAPMFSGVDMEDSQDPASFDPEKLKDGVLSMVKIYSVDFYDMVDVAQMAVGDYFANGGKVVRVETLEEDDERGHKLINGGYENGGFTLTTMEDTNGLVSIEDDDFNSYTLRAVRDLPLAEDVSFTDGADIESEPTTVTGIEAVTRAIQKPDDFGFDFGNTDIRIVNGKIAEINRHYVP